MKKATLLIVGIFLCPGCTPQPNQQTELCIMELGRPDGPYYIYLPNDYGFLINWGDNAEPQLYIYNKPAHKIKMTNDFSVFIEEIKQFPDGVKVDRIRGCAITAGGMSKENMNIMDVVIQKMNFTLTGIEDGNFGVCTCETSYVHRYKTADDIKRHVAMD